MEADTVWAQITSGVLYGGKVELHGRPLIHGPRCMSMSSGL